MARAPRQPVPVEVAPDGSPVAFTWHGVTYRVRVISHWYLRDRWWEPDAAHGRTQCHFYRVVTPDHQVFELCRDVAWDPPLWTLDKIID